MRIAGRQIGPDEPTYIIAEMSANHNQDFDQAVQLIRAAKEAGADAVKLQTYTPDTLTIDSDEKPFRIQEGTIWEGKNLYALYSEAYTPWEWQPKLAQIANDLDMHCFSTPFDATAVDFLEQMKVPAYKIASFEIVDIPLIERVARTGKPIILSTGMATLDEIEEAISTVATGGGTELALLKCTSAYPAAPEEMNLRTIPDMAARFGLPVGISDHTLGITVPVTATALGACIVEKHLTLSRRLPGPDSLFSLEPKEFKDMVDAIRIAEKALGEVSYELLQREAACRMLRRSLFVIDYVKAGERFSLKNVRCIRPGDGLHPRHLAKVLAARAATDIQRGTPLNWNLVSR